MTADLSYMDTRLLMALVNFAICSGIGFVALCRVNGMSIDTRYLFRGMYVGIGAAATVSGFQPWFGSWPSLPDVLVSAALLVLVGTGRHAWRHGPPGYAQRPRPLREAADEFDHSYQIEDDGELRRVVGGGNDP